MGLVARALEDAGIATVIIGSALDIIELCGVPRYLFVDFPLGNPCGKPWDEASQARIMSAALALFETAAVPGTTVIAAESWSATDAWRENYMHVGADNIDALRAAGARRREAQAEVRARKRNPAG